MGTTLQAQAPAPYERHRIWLIISGAAEILVGFCFLRLAAGANYAISSIPGEPSFSLRDPATVIRFELVYFVLLATVFFTAGVGSILCRNWARIASFVISGLWLFTSLLILLLVIFFLPRLAEQESGTHEPTYRKLFSVLDISAVLFWVFVPAVFLFFYSRKSVKETCLARRRHQPVHVP